MTDDVCGSPWRGTVSSRKQYLQLNLTPFVSHISEPPETEVLVEGYCVVCGGARIFRIGPELWSPLKAYSFRESQSCSGCSLNARTRAFIHFLEDHGFNTENKRVYITEKLTPLFRYLQTRYEHLEGSEFFSDVVTGSKYLGTRVEDIMNLTYADSSFDSVFSLDVMEHVPDYRKAFREVFRVLRPGGDFIATFPFDLDLEKTFSRATIGRAGEVIHVMEPEFHGNPVGEPSLCFTEFGWDILNVLRTVGFQQASVTLYSNSAFGYLGREQPIFRMRRPPSIHRDAIRS